MSARWLDWLFPPQARCMGCGSVRLPQAGPPLCPACRELAAKAALPKPFCAWCGYPAQGRPCLQCAAPQSQRLDWLTAPFAYRPPISSMIRRLKYGGWGQAVPFLAREMAGAWEACGQPPPELCAFVPMTSRRRGQRGGNHAELLCRELCRITGWPAAPVLTRVREGKHQAGLDRAQRRANVRKAFAASAQVKGRRVLIVDDVVTTCATMGDCARALRAAGAVWVGAAAAAVELKTVREKER